MPSRPWTFRAAATTVALAAATATISTFAVAQADTTAAPAAANRTDPQPAKTTQEHDFDGPLSRTQEAQREEALKQVISGAATVKNRDGSKVVELKSRKGDSKYVKLGREQTDKIFTILVEFGEQTDPATAARPAPRTTR